ncbi:hypothetical protein [Hymenobacter glaciei]|uniref:hypothetical protein n=1 Tax=Hymenobacter glaciei TaxID=877209 RepID=UPI0031E5C05F
MVCLDCGRPATVFSSYCVGCRTTHRQHPGAQPGFWDKFTTKSSRYTRQYDFARPAVERSFFSGWWPLKLLFLPFWLLWKLVQLLR